MRVLTRLMLAAVALGVLAAAQGQSRPDLQLKAAVYKETVEGDLKGAADLYKQVASNADAPRQVAAAALLGLGGCYEKLGQQDAQKVYERLVAEFSDQTREVAQARQRLAALAASAPARADDSRLTIRRVPDLDMYAKPSPDGKYLAFVDWQSGNLAIRDVATGVTRALTRDAKLGAADYGYAEFSAWSRDSRRIAYGWAMQNASDNRTELRVVSVEGETAPRRVPVPGADWVEPLDWSSDGSRVLCAYGLGRRESGYVLVGVDRGSIDKQDVPPAAGLGLVMTSDGGLLYSAFADGTSGPRDIFLRNPKTGVAAPVFQHPAEDLVLGILPGTEWLLFASDRRGTFDLWAVPFRQGRADGEPVVVKQGLGRLFPLGFTNDGRYYYATLSATDDVYLADFDRDSGRVSGEARKIVSRWDGVSAFPSFSPDGANLAYAVKRGLNPLPVHGTDSLVVRSLKDPKADPVVVGFEEFGLMRVVGPCWLADGTAVVVGGYGSLSEDLGLYRVDFPGLKKSKIYSADGGTRMIAHECGGGRPSIFVQVTTPDAGQNAEPAERVIRVDATGDNGQEVFRTSPGQRIGGIAAAPDGRRLSIVTRLDRYRRAVLVMTAEGGAPRQIHEFRQPSGGGVDLAWSPDGRSILYVQMSESWKEDQTFFLRSVRADGTSVDPLTVFRWTGQFFWLSFRPDGRMLAFSGRPNVSTSSEVWVIENLREELKLLAPSRPKRP